jgi:hypothetical protein
MGNLLPFVSAAFTLSATSGRPVLYTWDVHSPAGAIVDQGACGVTSEPRDAVAELHGALRGLPRGSYGTVRKVTTSLSGEVRYLDLGKLGDARRTRQGVSWVTHQPALSPSLP